MIDITKTKTWKENFGLLPIHLSTSATDINNFILLNGGTGDFCFSTSLEDLSPEQYNSKSWSSNTKNFVVLDDEYAHIYNWKKNAIEKIKKDAISKNFNKFYKYIVSNSYKTDNDVVPFLVDIFKQFRNHTKETTNATEALNMLFTLLASLEESSITPSIASKWGLNEIYIPSNFDNYQESLHKGAHNTKPILDLIIRHTSGMLFQEAQKEAVFFDTQLDLFGNFSNSLNTKNNIYSSVHYTPSYLSRTIVENTIDKIDLNKSVIKIIDPACGSGEFLAEALKQLKELGYEGRIEIQGMDSSETAINTTRFLLTYEKRKIWKDKLDFELKVVHDSLEEQWDNDFDIILMNPPFVSWEQMDTNSKEAVRHTLGEHKQGKPNQASAFFYKAISSLSRDGAIGCVMPSSLLTLDSYKNLRKVCEDLITIDLIGKLGNFIFEDALTDVSLLIGHKPKDDTTPYLMWVTNERGAAQDALRDLRKMKSSGKFHISENDYSIYQPFKFPIANESWKPISYSENEFIKKLSRLTSSEKLVVTADIFKVQQGIRTGNNSVFIISAQEFNDLPITEQSFFRPSVDNDSIKNGSLKKINYVWYPYASNGILISDEDQLKELVPVYYEKTLLRNKDILSKRARKDITNWWYLSEYRAWLIEQKIRLISTEFGDSSSFALDKQGEFAIERGNYWNPKEEFSEIEDYYFYLALFSSNLFEKLLSIFSRQLAGAKYGVKTYDLGNKYVKDIPIPNIYSQEVKESKAYQVISETGKAISKGERYSKTILNETLRSYFYPFDET